GHTLPARRAAARLRFLRVEPLEDRALLTLSGVMSIGPSGDFKTIDTALSAIRNQGLGGALTLEFQSAYKSSDEPSGGAINLSNIVTSATNTLTLRPASGATVAITSSDPTATVSVDLASFITIDGRAGGVGPAKNLIIENTSTTGAAVQLVNDSTNN